MTCGCNPNTSAQKTGACEAGEARRVQPREVFKPQVDIHETPDAYTVIADMPGAREQDVDIRFEDGTLTIAARVADRAATPRKPLVREYGVGDFERSFRIGEGIDVEHIGATLKQGVLTLTLPKAERVKPRKIEVRTA